MITRIIRFRFLEVMKNIFKISEPQTKLFKILSFIDTLFKKFKKNVILEETIGDDVEGKNNYKNGMILHY